MLIKSNTRVDVYGFAHKKILVISRELFYFYTNESFLRVKIQIQVGVTNPLLVEMIKEKGATHDFKSLVQIPLVAVLIKAAVTFFRGVSTKPPNFSLACYIVCPP